MESCKFLFLDVAGTLLGKPQMFNTLHQTFAKAGINLNMQFLQDRHRMLSEVIRFPDRTSREFYLDFNTELQLFLGLNPDPQLSEQLYLACRYLPWEAYPDVAALAQVKIPMGIISNWDTTLPEKLKEIFPTLNFQHILVSEQLGVRKPDPEIFHLALKKAGLKAEDCAFVGDSLRLDIAPAAKAGLKPILIDRQNIWAAFQGERISGFDKINL